MKFSQIVCKINKITLNVIKLIVTSSFQCHPKSHFGVCQDFIFIYIKTRIYFILYSITYQNIKTIKKSFFVDMRQLFKVTYIFSIFFQIFTLCDDVTM